jgi:hypothetical protein
VDGGQQGVTPGLLQIRQADGHDQEGLDAFAERDDERLNHD